MKKVFVVAGEASGDTITGWYLAKRQQQEQLYIEGIGGHAAQAAGMRLYESFHSLNVVGIVEIIKHLPRLMRKMREIGAYIKREGFAEVILVDFPGFNLRLARLLKKQIPHIEVTYVSPPQLWVWGAWRLRGLKATVDQLVVMYPFEVAWYQARGVDAVWLGSPVVQALQPHMTAPGGRGASILLLPGSRLSEVTVLLPVFLQVADALRARYESCSFVLPVPQSLTVADYERIATAHGMQEALQGVQLVHGQVARYAVMQTACAALAKPGTVTLELGLLQVPTVIAFKTSWLSYVIGKRLVRVPRMGLANLLTGQDLHPEFIQDRCTVPVLVHALGQVVDAFLHDAGAYEVLVSRQSAVRRALTAPMLSRC